MIGSTGRIRLSAKGLMRPLVTTLLAAAALHGQNAPAGLHDIAERAYIYAYPLVLLEATRGAQSVNQFTHVPQFPRPDIRQIVRPNADTLYSTAWLDGEVYRAKDTKLKRDVALKVLPEAFARDPGRMARFQREAEVLAALNHPNIAHIYSVEDRALVMEGMYSKAARLASRNAQMIAGDSR